MIRILYVDDEPDIREVAEMALSLDPEFTVRTAASGTEALVTAAQWAPSLILLDVMMPGMDGPQVLSRLREQPETAGIPVVFVTARAQRTEIQNFATLDAMGVIAKPFDPINLPAQVRAFL
jgi:CheY-like chemotaxis protein